MRRPDLAAASVGLTPHEGEIGGGGKKNEVIFSRLNNRLPAGSQKTWPRSGKERLPIGHQAGPNRGGKSARTRSIGKGGPPEKVLKNGFPLSPSINSGRTAQHSGRHPNSPTNSGKAIPGHALVG